MRMRVTTKDLEAVISRINAMTGNKPEAYTQTDNGYKANVGTYVLDGAYGGWKLQQIVNEHGAVTNITTGYVPKRELYHQMQALIKGFEVANS
jgi:hypothetical protein